MSIPAPRSYIYVYICTYVYIHTYTRIKRALRARSGPLWARRLWDSLGALWVGPPWAPLGTHGPGPCQPPWALMGRALVDPLGLYGPGHCDPPLRPCGAGPCGPPWDHVSPGPGIRSKLRPKSCLRAYIPRCTYIYHIHIGGGSHFLSCADSPGQCHHCQGESAQDKK